MTEYTPIIRPLIAYGLNYRNREKDIRYKIRYKTLKFLKNYMSANFMAYKDS